MSDIQIGQLPLTTSLYGNSQLPIETANVTYKIYGTSIKDYVTSLAFLNSAGNITIGNIAYPANLNTSGNVYSNSLIVTGNVYGTLSVATQLGITRTGTLGNLVVTGNVTAGNVAGIQIQANTGIFKDIYGNIKTPAQTSITSVGSLIGLTATGNVEFSNSTSSNDTTTGALVIAGGVGIGGNVNVGGYIKTPTPAPGSNDTQVATTAWVKSFATAKADLNSPTFTGAPVFPSDTTAITQAPGTNNTKLATTEFVNEANVGLANRVNSLLSSKAPLNNPTFSGNVNGITKLMVGLGLVDNTNDASKPVSAPTLSALNLKANIDSPTFTGTVNLPANALATTQPAGTSNTAVATTSFVTTALASAVPTGTILMWSTSSAPSGYLICNGGAIGRTTYASLFSVISTTFGPGDNSTTFNVPNFTNRMPIGPGSLASVGSTGGSKDAVVVAHTHSITDPGHFHATNWNNINDFNQGGQAPGAEQFPDDIQGTFGINTDTKTTGISLSSEGVSGTDKNLPPYLGIYFIIKT